MRTANLSLILLLMFAFVAAAQDEAPPAAEKKKPAVKPVEETAEEAAEEPGPPEFDEGAKKIWDAWKRMHYNLGEEGVKRASHGVEATVKMMGQTMQATGVFKWDGEKGSLDWKGNQQASMMLAQQGWGVDQMSSHYRKDGLEDGLEGCKITLRAGETEDRLEVAGAAGSAPIKAFIFGKDGVLKGMVLEIPDPGTGQAIPVDFDMGFKKLDNGKYFNTGWEFTANFSMGAFTEKTTLTVEKRGAFYVLTAADSNGMMGGQPMMSKTLRFTDWKFNDDVGKAETKKKAEAPAGAETPDDG
jgi:hypothetical protein